ncbi:CREB-binding protein-like [Neocloeon triangulifer]|uniref:CREB-binding protein-like n=1 Tax=Neocloeon triangulifer TaxID=2078957 RepID=UPI00286F5C8B|nr:CREB-binding protein-like [Neocloeon triangulifer]XP_059488978.1 CREB-binding protein-like [Neocloeon triangulifer]
MAAKPKNSRNNVSQPANPNVLKVELFNAEGRQLEVRRFNIDKNNIHFDEFKEKISKTFPALHKNNTFSISYKDLEGDAITVSSDEELKLCLEQKDVPQKLQAKITPNPTSSAPPQKTKTIPAVHTNIKCNECKKEIKGIRYRCVVCVDYDICHPCELKSVHEHPMLKLPKVISRVESLVGGVCQMLKILMAEQDCKHKDCWSCQLRRTCPSSWREGTMNRVFINFAKIADAEVGKCSKCDHAPQPAFVNGNGLNTPRKTIPVVNGAAHQITNGMANMVFPKMMARIQTVAVTGRPLLPSPLNPLGTGMPPGMVPHGAPIQYIPQQPTFAQVPPYFGPSPFYNPFFNMPMMPMGPGMNQPYPPQMWSDPPYQYPNQNVAQVAPAPAPTAPTPTQSLPGTSQRSSPHSEEESVDVQIQRGVLQLSAKGYIGDVEKLGEILRSVDLDVEKACKILDKEKSG